jgi:Hemerythrin HHE cation binding domain
MTTMLAMERLTSTSPDLPPDLYGYAAMHLGMHRDAARLVRTLETVPRDPAALERWWHRYRDVIVRHHEREDDIIWPALAAVDETFVADVAKMHEDHDELDRAMGRLGVALTAVAARHPDPAPLPEARAAATTFQRVLRDHVAREEEVAFHRLAARPVLWAEIDDQLARGVGVREAAFHVPWMHDSLDVSKSAPLWRKIPGFARPIARRIWLPRYARLVATALDVQEAAG